MEPKPVTMAVTAITDNLKNYREINGVNVPLEYLDACTFEIMTNPVIVCPSGNTYDQSTIDRIFLNTTPKDPLSGCNIQKTIENRALKTTIERFVKMYPAVVTIHVADMPRPCSA